MNSIRGLATRASRRIKAGPEWMKTVAAVSGAVLLGYGGLSDIGVTLHEIMGQNRQIIAELRGQVTAMEHHIAAADARLAKVDEAMNVVFLQHTQLMQIAFEVKNAIETGRIQKGDFGEYIYRSPLWTPSKAGGGHSDVESGEVP